MMCDWSVASHKMTMYDHNMDISVTQFRAICLELIRGVESGGEPVDIKRRGKIVARLTPPPSSGSKQSKPWEVLRNTGTLKSEPEESVFDEQDFEAYR